MAHWPADRVNRVASVALGIVFGVAALSKLQSLPSFTDALYEAALLPFGVVPVLALAIPAVEIMLAWMLLVGCANRLALGMATLLLGAFTMYLMLLLWKYTVPPDCHCIGGFERLVGTGRPATIAALVRNALLIVLVGIAWWGLERGRACCRSDQVFSYEKANSA